MILNSPTISGSLTVTGNIITSGSITISGSIASASYASNAELLDGLDATVFTLTSSFIAQTASFTAFTASLNAFSASQNSFTASILAQTASLNSFSASILSYTASQNILNGTYTLTSSFNAQTASFTAFTSSINAFSASILTFTGSATTRLGALESYTSSLNNKTASFATTGSNTFIGTQTITGSVLQSGSFTSTGTLTAQTLVVQTITSSVVYSSGSNIFGNAIANTQTFTGSVLITGSLTIAGASSATSYSGATIFGSTIACSPIGCFATSCATAFIGGTMSGTTIYGSTAVCSPVGLFSGCVNIGTAGSEKLNIFGAGSQFINVKNTTSNADMFVGMSSALAAAFIGTGGTDPIVFSTAGSEKMRITNGGNVGIGTCVPSDRLSITDASTYTFNIGAAAGGAGAVLYTLGSAALTFATCGSSNERMRITCTGQVAIGATSNLNNFTIKSSSDTITSGGLSFQSRTCVTNFIAMGLNSCNDFEIQTWTAPSWITRLYIKNNGNIGIDTTVGTAALGIGGSGAQTTANLTDGGSRIGIIESIPIGGEAGNGGALVLGSDTWGNGAGRGQIALKALLINGSGCGTSDLAFSLRNDPSCSNLTERMRITSAGIACFACQVCAPSGVKFGSGSSTLNYYETGTWTPEVIRSTANPTVSYSSRVGTYTRIGNTVNLWFDAQISSISGGSGTYYIAGLPFTVSNSQAGYSRVVWRDFTAACAVANTVAAGFVEKGDTYIYPQYDFAGACGFGTCTALNLQAGRFTGFVSYQA